ncbi:permease-like cell division protein FtsX [Candidatus Parcubacteria bacterium]|nr:permease-like cell division protein FtsX [Patescibacteria group bacterium]MCG2694282.1 permease-like cell division protein FtsX [Candidatus Parcubacteria bacterium]
MISNLQKIFKFGAQNFARNFWLKILTIVILTVLLLLINGLVIINFLTNEASRQVQSKVDVSIYLKTSATNEEAQSLRSYLMSLANVSNVTYKSSDDVLKEFKETHKDDQDILSSLTFLETNPFGGALVVQTVNVNDYNTVLKQLDTPIYDKIIENKDFGDNEKLIEVINRMTSFVKQFIVLISLFFALIAVIVIFNTIRMGIDAHRHEISIMRLVGAANWFVKGQFVVELLIYSTIAAIASLILIFPIISVIQPNVLAFFNGQAGDIFAYYRANIFGLFALQFVGIFAFSLLSAWFALGRYLKK